MKKINQSVKFILELEKTQAILGRRFDSGLGGLGLNEFTILHNLSIAPGEKLRRIDLAGKVGLTASGITRLLLPMEKIGLVKSGESENDARARYVMIAAGGKRKLEEAIERMELLLKEILPDEKKEKIQAFSEFLVKIQSQTYLN
ncbi:MAG: winged helix-turn-helix transcriptional regulator [Candidatus Moranbacteria bacterium]|nr:winged helix-turn-helix transcriptional regulator [Candidatus Moranbacteria bacterium]